MSIYKVWITEPRVGKYSSCTENTIESESMLITLTKDGRIKDIYDKDRQKLNSIKEIAKVLDTMEKEVIEELKDHLDNFKDSIYILYDPESNTIQLNVNRQYDRFDKTDLEGIHRFIQKYSINTDKVDDYTLSVKERIKETI